MEKIICYLSIEKPYRMYLLSRNWHFMHHILEHGAYVSVFWLCAYWWLLLQTRFAQTVQRSHLSHSQNSESLAGVPNMMHESQLLNHQNTSMISLYLHRHHFLHGRRRLGRGACVSTWTVQTLPAPPNDWSILTIWSLWCREVFLLWMLLNVDETENIWFWVAWENL